MNRTDLQRLSDARVEDAEVLLQAGRWAAAYYLLGYAVECALKACAARQFQQDEVPEKALVNDFYTHRMDKLLSISGVEAALDARMKADLSFRENWKIVRDWNEAARYAHTTKETLARGLLAAVVDPDYGVLSWVKTQW